MVQTLKNIAEANWFSSFITFVILLAGVVVGMETYPSLIKEYGAGLHLLNDIILWIFVLEVLIKMGAEGSKPWRYFLDPWNIFDFSIVAAAFLPFGGSSVAVLRLIRLLRVLRLVTAVPKLQLLVGALIKSIPSMGYVSILLFLLFYVYGVAAVLFFGTNDPVHFADLPMAMLSLFRAVTLEDWTDLMYIQMYGCDNYGYGGMENLCTAPKASPVFGAVFFVSFVLVGTMVILNLFIGVIMNGMDEAKLEFAEADAEKRGDTPLEVEEQLAELQKKLKEMTEYAHAIEHYIRSHKKE